MRFHTRSVRSVEFFFAFRSYVVLIQTSCLTERKWLLTLNWRVYFRVFLPLTCKPKKSFSVRSVVRNRIVSGDDSPPLLLSPRVGRSWELLVFRPTDEMPGLFEGARRFVSSRVTRAAEEPHYIVFHRCRQCDGAKLPAYDRSIALSARAWLPTTVASTRYVQGRTIRREVR